jgi:hypothetical protein
MTSGNVTALEDAIEEERREAELRKLIREIYDQLQLRRNKQKLAERLAAERMRAARKASDVTIIEVA